LLSLDCSIQEAIKNLDDVGVKIVLVTDKNQKLIGTISDGDVRRGILKGLDLESPIENILHKNPFVVPPEMPRHMVLQLMEANKIQQIPIVDQKGVVEGLQLWDEISAPSIKTNKILIMAGGIGSRLGDHTKNCPKPLLPVAGKPMLQHIIERAREEGFTNFILSVGYLAPMIEEFFGDGSNFEVVIKYLHEDSPLGTAGALGLINPVPEESLIITNGDVISDIRFGELLDFHQRHNAVATMAVRSHEWQHPFGVVETNGVDIVRLEEKPVYRSHINAGVYAIEPEVIVGIEENIKLDMPELFEKLKFLNKKTIAFPMHEPWLDVGKPADLLKANTEKSN